MEIIRRAWNLDTQCVRADSEEFPKSAGTFEGHAAVFNQETLIGSVRWGFLEEVAPGAFDDNLGDDVRFLFNHDGQPMARTTNGTLTLSQDSIGLRNVAEIALTTLGRDLVLLLDRGDISEQSFAFTVKEDKWEAKSIAVGDETFEIDKRTILKVQRLYDVSPVTYPAYGGTDAGMRCYRGSGADMTAEIEAALRASGRSDREVQATLREANRLKDFDRDAALRFARLSVKF